MAVSELSRPGAGVAIPAVIRPVRLAHVVMRTSRFAQMSAWYKSVLDADTTFENDLLSFLTFDDEHHRVALLNVPDLKEQTDGVAGVHHVAFTYGTLAELLTHYERLAEQGVRPVFCINHGPTTSLYYADPDGNQLELQVDNFDTADEAVGFFHSDAFAANPIGAEVDPTDLLRRLRAGESEAALKRRADVGARGLDDIKLR